MCVCVSVLEFVVRKIFKFIGVSVWLLRKCRGNKRKFCEGLEWENRHWVLFSIFGRYLIVTVN